MSVILTISQQLSFMKKEEFPLAINCVPALVRKGSSPMFQESEMKVASQVVQNEQMGSLVQSVISKSKIFLSLIFDHV